MKKDRQKLANKKINKKAGRVVRKKPDHVGLSGGDPHNDGRGEYSSSAGYGGWGHDE